MRLDIAVTIDHFLICNRFLHIITLKKPKKTNIFTCLLKKKKVFLLHLAMEKKQYLILLMHVPKGKLYRLHRNTKTSLSFSAFFTLFHFYWQIVCALYFSSGKCLNFIISLWPHEAYVPETKYRWLLGSWELTFFLCSCFATQSNLQQVWHSPLESAPLPDLIQVKERT